jgi:hypothetical protein
MKGTILLNYDADVRREAEIERHRFLKELLDQMGVPVTEFWTSDGLLSIQEKIKLREILLTYSVQVIDDLDGHMQVYVEDELVGEWHKCNYKIKRDLRQRDPRKQLFIEMEVNCWSLFEETEQQ